MRLVCDQRGRLLRAAVVSNDGRLRDLYCDRIDRPALAGAVVAARVVRVAGGLRAAFLTWDRDRDGDSAQGMLNLGGRGNLASPQAGDRLLVQVLADGTGSKAARVTRDIALPGRSLVLTPLAAGLRLSRRIGRGALAPALQTRLMAALPHGAGWIVRSRAVAVPAETVLAEAARLCGVWQTVRAAFEQGRGGVLMPAPGLVERVLTDLDRAGGGEDTADRLRLVLQRGPVAAAAMAWCRQAAPDLLAGLDPPGGVAHPFDAFGLEDHFAALLAPTVPLSGGGSLTIERTRALTVVDVDGGESGNREAVNRAALEEVAQQVRLRNLSGIIVVDCLNLPSGTARDRLVAHLTTLVAEDARETTVHGLTRLGLLELSRTRRTPSLDELTTPGWDQDASVGKEGNR